MNKITLLLLYNHNLKTPLIFVTIKHKRLLHFTKVVLHFRRCQNFEFAIWSNNSNCDNHKNGGGRFIIEARLTFYIFFCHLSIESFFQSQQCCVNGVFQFNILSVSYSTLVFRLRFFFVRWTNLFSKKVFALTMFLPIAEAFQAKYDPDGSTW